MSGTIGTNQNVNDALLLSCPSKSNLLPDAAKASSAVLAECAAGTIFPSEASEIMALIQSHIRVLEVTELEARVIALENSEP